MAKKVYEEENIRAIADKIREKTGSNETYKTSEIPHGIEMVYKAGQDDGVGYEEGYEAGQKAEYDKFWDNLQNFGGEVVNYYAFAYNRFNDENYNPKYPINCSQSSNSGSQRVFYNASNITDIKVPFYASKSSMNQCFYGCTKLVTIPLIRLYETTVLENAFSNCESLVNVAFEGVIGNDISFKDCTQLTHDSLMSIINALKDLRAFERIDIYNDEKYSGTVQVIDDNFLPQKQLQYDSEYKVLSVDQGTPTITFDLEFDFETEDEVPPDMTLLSLYWICPTPPHPYEKDASKVKAVMFHNDNTFTLISEPTETKTLTLGATNLAKLTDEEKAIATNKGWVLA